MKAKLTGNIFWISLLIILVVIFAYTGFSRMENIGIKPNKAIELNSAEKKYINNQEVITIAVDKELLYLNGDNEEDGYLQECLERMLEPSGLRAALVDQEADADCRLEIVTPHSREQAGEIKYSSPLFQIEGAMFLNKEGQEDNRGCAVKWHITEKKLKTVRLDSRKIKCSYRGDNYSAVRETVDNNLKFVIGDADAIMSFKDYSEQLEMQEDVLYRRNVCIVVPEENELLYGIINASIQSTDRHGITYELAEKYFDGNAPVYMKDNRSDMYFYIIIIFAAVIVAFFIYYITNRNMYRELENRMNKLMESRKELQTTFNGVRYLLAETTTEGRILDINKAFRDFAGRGLIGLTLLDVLELDQDSKDKLEEIIAKAALGEKPESIELTVGSRLFSIEMFQIEGARGQIEKLLFVGMDITGERMAERQMLQDNKMIAIGQLAAGVAHEIRNPLGLIRNYCYVLKNFKDEKVRAEAVDEIEQAVETSNGIITNLLGFSKDNGGYVQRINVRELIEQIVTISRKTSERENIELTVSCSNDLELVTRPESLNMIIINLLQNAADAIEDSGKIIIAAEEKASGIVISVKDNGCGIEEGALQEIYNPFYTTKGTNGTGLGLYLVYNEIEKLNGKISVKSKVGEGTRFTVELPDLAGLEEFGHE